MPRPEKEKTVEELAHKLTQSRTTILTDYMGLNVQAMTELREQFREAGIEYKVFKNTLARIAVSKSGLENLLGYIEGPTGYAFSEDPVVPAKLLVDFSKANPQMNIKCALIMGQVYDGAKARSIASLPPREVLLSQLFGQMQAPITGLAIVLNGPIRKLVYALEDLRRKKEAA